MMRTLLCILLVCAQATWAADHIGRLFTSPAERSNLDYLRQTKKNIPAKAEAPAEESPSITREPIALPDAVNVQGYVKRNDGKTGTVWVNNKAMEENSADKELQVGRLPTNSNRVPIKIQANGKMFTLKAGQVYDPETGRVREARNHGAQGDTGRIGDEDTP